MIELSPRQVHLDFHTSEHIPDIASDFDPEVFAHTAAQANVSSMTVFARCHHGWMYYPTHKFPEQIHPGLTNRNLLLEQVRALHGAGIKAPVYTTVQWDYAMATTHPQWLIRKEDGSHEGDSFTKPGFYQSLCVNTSYYDYLAEHTAEVCEMVGEELDGLFFDIVGIRPCWCSACRAQMKERGIDVADAQAVRAFAADSMNRFKQKMTALVRGYHKDCTIFYNAGHVGPATRASKDAYSHFELESLPSGAWGYLHFPVTARYARTLGLDCLGMTGKFHTEWGDFHSLKNQAALEFECFRMLSYGFASSIGDQLEPYGVLNPATYRLIGNVYSQFAARERWARPSRPVVEAAVVTSEDVSTEHSIPQSLMGATQMLEELAIQFDIIDQEAELTAYPLVILPDDLIVSDDLAGRLERYAGSGGKILAVGKGGLNAQGEYPACFGVEYAGEATVYPDFIRAEGELASGLEEGNEYVIYQRGECARATCAKPVLYATSPYFKREGDRFCSHRYTPSAKGEPYAVGFRNDDVLLLTHPLFSQYRHNAPRWCKTLVSNAIDSLTNARLVRHNGPSTLSVSLLEQTQQQRYCLHVLSYVPVRKSATIDIIEERTVVCDLSVDLTLPKQVKAARLVPDGQELTIQDGRIVIPRVDGYAIVELSY